MMRYTCISKKTFDKAPHKSLTGKCENGGELKGATLRWMEDYLQGREKRTVVRDINSSVCEVTGGVPQGAVLAPIVFQIYVNNMTDNLVI